METDDITGNEGGITYFWGFIIILTEVRSFAGGILKIKFCLAYVTPEVPMSSLKNFSLL